MLRCIWRLLIMLVYWSHRTIMSTSVDNGEKHVQLQGKTRSQEGGHFTTLYKWRTRHSQVTLLSVYK